MTAESRINLNPVIYERKLVQQWYNKLHESLLHATYTLKRPNYCDISFRNECGKWSNFLIFSVTIAATREYCICYTPHRLVQQFVSQRHKITDCVTGPLAKSLKVIIKVFYVGSRLFDSKATFLKLKLAFYNASVSDFPRVLYSRVNGLFGGSHWQSWGLA